MRQPTFHLTDAQVAAYHDEGFLTLPPLTPPGEAGFIAGVLRQLWSDLHGCGRDAHGGMLTQIVNPIEYAPALLDTHLRANATAIARRILGPACACTGEQALIKPAGEQRVIWHQDEAHWNPAYHYEAVTLWISLTEAGPATGCMMFVPGSHRGGIDPHIPLNPAAPHPDLARLHRPEQWRVCPSVAGAGSIHGPRTVHASAPHLGEVPRLAYAMTYMNRPTPRSADTAAMHPATQNVS